MESSRIFLLLIGIGCMTLVRHADAVCCSTGDSILFTMESGKCEDVGGEALGEFEGYCTARICADGSPLLGRFCGNGNCNMFGCNCAGGCRTGSWGVSFEKINTIYDVSVFSSELY
ncbi:hypothetical protein KR032_009613 [Drosophila birchii]|nr:hypothetical protein KR032_009613 [Drosophila birchii]